MTNQEPASILLIDDHPMLRTGVKQLVSMAPDITVVGEASNGEQGIELAESLDPDLILLDLNMPGRMAWKPSTSCGRNPSLAGWWSSASQTMKKTWSPPSSGGQTAIC
ncbi:nitrate/nitrite response regulator protein narL [Enterobacter hormaechei]|nr:nitrate/nitrite response regulator protein narL [Enterobacter hormaechei]